VKYLLVGDVHATPDELEDCEALVEGILKCPGDTVVFMGDQHHTHGVVRLEVVDFWRRAFARINRPIIALVGNHDRPGNGNLNYSAMDCYEQNYRFSVADPFYSPLDEASYQVEVPFFSSDLFVSYVPTEAQFKDILAQHPGVKTIFCHQTFQGAKYENGFFAEDGFQIPSDQRVFSGHIHTPMDIGSLTYVGAPRWRTLADANVKRHLLLVEDGKVLDSFDTSQFCTPITFYEDRETAPVAPVYGKRVYVDIHGSEAYVRTRVPLWKHARFRTFVEKPLQHHVKESDGIEVAFSSYTNRYEPVYGTPQDKLLEMAKERL